MVVLNPDSILTGPFKTPRWGRTVTLDLGAPDVTLAISRDNRLPRASVVVTLAARELMRLSKDGEKVDHIVVVGSDTDPTRHPAFREITENLRELRDKWFSRAKLCLVSNDPLLDSQDVRLGVGAYDLPVIRLEYGTTKTFARLTGRKSTELAPLVHQIASLDRVVVRANFVRGTVDNSTENEVKGWLKRLQDVRLAEVQITSPNPRSTSKLKGVTKSRLREIVEQVSESTGATVTVLEPDDSLV